MTNEEFITTKYSHKELVEIVMSLADTVGVIPDKTSDYGVTGFRLQLKSRVKQNHLHAAKYWDLQRALEPYK